MAFVGSLASPGVRFKRCLHDRYGPETYVSDRAILNRSLQIFDKTKHLASSVVKNKLFNEKYVKKKNFMKRTHMPRKEKNSNKNKFTFKFARFFLVQLFPFCLKINRKYVYYIIQLSIRWLRKSH